MILKSVTFFLTDRCNAACDVCCFQCSPRNTFVMDKETIKRYIDEAASMGTAGAISYTGGECLLYPDLLMELTSYAKEKYGLTSHVVSNGFWAADYAKGKALMTRLKESGLSEVRLSADTYHQKFVSVKTIKNAIRILVELKMISAVTVMENRSRSNTRAVVEQLRPEIYMVDEIAYYPMYLPTPVLANPNIKETEADLLRPIVPENAFCVDAESVQLYTDGYMYNCCSQFSFEIPQMRVGKIGETTLKEAMQTINRDPVLDLIRRAGLGWFAKKAVELGYPVKENYSMSCELCRDILCNQELMAKLRPMAEAEVQKRRVEKFLSL